MAIRAIRTNGIFQDSFTSSDFAVFQKMYFVRFVDFGRLNILVNGYGLVNLSFHLLAGNRPVQSSLCIVNIKEKNVVCFAIDCLPKLNQGRMNVTLSRSF